MMILSMLLWWAVMLSQTQPEEWGEQEMSVLIKMERK